MFTLDGANPGSKAVGRKRFISSGKAIISISRAIGMNRTADQIFGPRKDSYFFI